MYQKQRFIILKSVKYSESDLIIHALLKTGEKINFIAKGARKSKKRFSGGVLEPTHFVEGVFSKTKGDLFLLQEAHLIKGFEKLRTSYEKLELAFYFLKLIDQVAEYGGLDSESYFDLLGNSLATLETVDSINNLKLHFEIKFLHYQGVLPEDNLYSEFLRLNIKDCEQVKYSKAHAQSISNLIQNHIRQLLPKMNN